MTATRDGDGEGLGWVLIWRFVLRARGWVVRSCSHTMGAARCDVIILLRQSQPSALAPRNMEFWRVNLA
jgi:hypothetical protein